MQATTKAMRTTTRFAANVAETNHSQGSESATDRGGVWRRAESPTRLLQHSETIARPTPLIFSVQAQSIDET